MPSLPWLSTFVACILALHTAPAAGADPLPAKWQQVGRAVFEEIVNINTSVEGVGTTRAAEAIATRLRAAGFAAGDIELVGPDPKNQNLVIRYRGRGAGKPLLLIAHLDTVTARAADWTTDPFTFLEKDGWWYGRGTSDNKAGVATLVTNLLRWKAEGFVPGRDLVVLLSAFEESGGSLGGMPWLVEHRPELRDAEYCLNTDAGLGDLRGGVPALFAVQAAEKVYQSFRLETTNPGGHSSMPRPDNAIYQLAGAVTKIGAFTFPVQLTDVTREFFARTGRLDTGPLSPAMQAIAANPSDANAAATLSQSAQLNSMLRTTCVATRLDAGHADNALPQRATAIVNCRILPGVDPAAVHVTLREVVGDPAVKIVPVEEAHPSPPSPVRPDIFGVIERLAKARWNVPTVPMMETGATDGLYLRIAGVPTYGVSAVFEDSNDIRAHGRDERVRAQSFYDAVAFWDDMIRELAR